LKAWVRRKRKTTVMSVTSVFSTLPHGVHALLHYNNYHWQWFFICSCLSFPSTSSFLHYQLCNFCPPVTSLPSCIFKIPLSIGYRYFLKLQNRISVSIIILISSFWSLIFIYQAIYKKIKELNFLDCRTKIRQVDSHSTLGSGVVVQVSGELSNNGQSMRRFMQTFVLAPGEVG